MYKTPWLFFISLFGFCLTTIVFINYSTWVGLYISTDGTDLTHTYFGFSSIITLVADLDNFYNSNADFIGLPILQKILQYWWDYAGGFYSLLATFSRMAVNGSVSTADIVKIATNILSCIFLGVTGPLFLSFLILNFLCWFVSYAVMVIGLVTNALTGVYNVSMPSVDYFPSETVSVLLKTPLCSPLGVQGVIQNTHQILQNTIFSC